MYRCARTAQEKAYHNYLDAHVSALEVHVPLIGPAAVRKVLQCLTAVAVRSMLACVAAILRKALPRLLPTASPKLKWSSPWAKGVHAECFVFWPGWPAVAAPGVGCACCRCIRGAPQATI